MAKAILEFDLTDSDDRMEHFRSVKALDMALALNTMLNNTQKGILNEVEFKKLNPYDAVELVYERFREEMDNRGIYLDDLIC